MLLTAAPVVAHHAFTAEFDAKKPVTIRGFVTKVEWTNPHVWVYLDVKDEPAPGRTGDLKWARRTSCRPEGGAASSEDR